MGSPPATRRSRGTGRRRSATMSRLNVAASGSSPEPATHAIKKAAVIGRVGNALLEAHREFLDALRRRTVRRAQDERRATSHGVLHVFVSENVARVEHAHAQELLGDLRNALVHDAAFARRTRLVYEEAQAAIGPIAADDFDDGVRVGDGR